MNEFKEFYRENRSYTISFILLTIICFVGVWLVYDHNRNKPIYHDTDGTMADLEKRIESVESRLGTMQGRIEQNQKTIESIARGISTSTGLVVEITEGTDRAEKRLDSAISRSQRIQAIIDEVERTNK